MGFFLKTPNKKNLSSIQFIIWISQEEKYVKYYTGQKINPENWDQKIQRPKIKRGKEGEQNRKINHLLNEYEQVLDKLKEFHGKGLNKFIIWSEFDKHFKKIRKESKKNFKYYYDLFINQKKESGSVKKTTIFRFENMYKTIIKLEKINNKEYYLKDFDHAFYMKFISYCRKKESLSDNTLKRKYGCLKSFLNWCNINGYNTDLSYKKIQIKQRETNHISLTEEDLIKLEELKLDDRLSYYRDLFLIGCYSGQRYSDYSRFNKKFRQGENIVIRAKKTGTFSFIYLNKRLLGLLEKYNWELTTISSPKFNLAIQSICKKAGFNETIISEKFYGEKKVVKELPRYKLIASHTARRTFITLSAQKNIPDHLVMKGTGIRNYKTFLNYVKLDVNKLNEENKKAWG